MLPQVLIGKSVGLDQIGQMFQYLFLVEDNSDKIFQNWNSEGAAVHSQNNLLIKAVFCTPLDKKSLQIKRKVTHKMTNLNYVFENKITFIRNAD